ncbi:MAG: N-acetylmuramoyl-L-alanine amidase [Oscillospiraceae bacterium]|nr:N-acetylmuramoyl-L-alanine amidase [Oscillospiraceae bacterium]
MKRTSMAAMLLITLLLTSCASPMTREGGSSEAIIPEHTIETTPETDAVTEPPTEAEATPPVLQTEPTTVPETEVPTEAIKKLSGVKIGIDPGHQLHGNNEQEAIAPGSSQTKNKNLCGTMGTATGIPEYVTDLEISMALKEQLEAEGATVYMTRETHDVSISNQERTKMMNELGVDLLLRIHCDASDNSGTTGIGLFVSKSYGLPEQSYQYAQIIQPILCETVVVNNRGIVSNDNYTGQNWAEVPCIMIECGFMTNPEEDRLLNDPTYQKKLAEGIVLGVEACFK